MRAGQVQQNQVRKIAGPEQAKILISHGLRALVPAAMVCAGDTTVGSSVLPLQHGHQLDFFHRFRLLLLATPSVPSVIRQAALSIPGDRRDTAGQLEVADGIICSTVTPRCGKQLDILIRHPYAHPASMECSIRPSFPGIAGA